MARKRQEQAHLPTMEPPKLPVIDRAVQEYVEARDVRMAAGKVEKDKKEQLISLLKEKDLPEYENGDIWVKLESKQSVKARIGGAEPDDDEDDEE